MDSDPDETQERHAGADPLRITGNSGNFSASFFVEDVRQIR
jgi:hypothetical protein